MSFRFRVATIAAVAVAVAIVLVASLVYVSTRARLFGSVDEALVASAEPLDADIRLDIQRGFRPFWQLTIPFGPRRGPYTELGYAQLVLPDGSAEPLVSSEGVPLRVSDDAVQVALGRAEPYFSTVQTPGETLRVYTTQIERGLAVQVARPIDDITDALAALSRQLLLGGLLGTVLAGGLGLLVADRVVRPVRDLTSAAEDVAVTQDLSHRIDVGGQDELARLARSFNAMLASLDQARRAQNQLVADASHELRTPLTSLRTNIEVLARVDELPTDERKELIDDVVVQLDEFGRLVSALVELARGDQPVRAPTELRLDELVGDVVDRTRSRARDREFHLEVAPTVVHGEADRLERAVSNLLDNAVKHGAGPIEVRVADGVVSVRDHGPGIAAEDLPHVFDRFYRAPSARGEAGSGLGLAIVKQVAEAHGGHAEALTPADGGTLLRLHLPTTRHADAPRP